MTGIPARNLQTLLRGATATGRAGEVDLYERFTEIREAAKGWLIDLGKNGYEHSVRLEHYLDVLTKKLLERDLLTQAEIFVLLCATYMHDIGYWHDGQLQVKGHPDRSRDLIEHQPEQYLLGDFARLEGHTPRVAQAVGWVSYGHCEETYLPLAQVPNSFSDQSISREILNLRKLAALLRVADEADDPYIRLPETETASIRSKTYLVQIGEETIRWYWKQAGVDDPGPWMRHLKEKQKILETSIDYLRDLTKLNWYLVLEPQVPEMAFPLPDKPSIAVLPFVNMSDDPKQEFFADGMSEDIITALSRSPYLFVIARTSTFTYKGKPVDVKRVSSELGVRYVLEGSVRRAGEMVRITAQLIDAITGFHLWAERYDRELSEIFAVQDEITLKILKTVHVKLQTGDWGGETGKGTQNLDAYLKCIEAREHYYHFNKEENAVALKLFEEAITLDPNYAFSYSGLAWAHAANVWLGVTRNPKESLGLAIQLGEKALALDLSSAAAHANLGYFYVMARQYDKAVPLAEKALAFDQNSSEVFIAAANVISWSGKPDEAIPLYHKSIRLNPFAPGIGLACLSVAYRLAGQYEEAMVQAKKAVEWEPTFLLAHIALTASCSLTGRENQAREAAKGILKINPNFSVDQLAMTLPYKDQSQVKLTIDALRKAGLK